MQKTLFTIAALIAAQSAQASLISLSFTGNFDTGALAGEAITGFIEIEDNGLLSGIADTSPLTLGDGDFLDFSIEFDDGGSLIFFDLLDDLDPIANFDDGAVVGIDYFGENFDGDLLDVFYDAFAANVASGISVEYESFFGDVSTGTLNLPINVPEPSSYAMLVGALALGLVVARRRKA